MTGRFHHYWRGQRKIYAGSGDSRCRQMTENQHLLAAHCDAKGKMGAIYVCSATAMALHGLNGAAA